VTIIPVPGVALTVLKGFIGANPWVVTHHWKNGSSTVPWTQSDLDLLANNVYNKWTTTVGTMIPTNVNVTEVDATDLSSVSGVGSLYTHAAVAGGRAGTLSPSSVCYVIQNRISARYRGGHPRTFWPGGVAGDMAGEATWNTTVQGTFPTQVVAYVSAIRGVAYSFGSGTLNHVIPRYIYNVTDDPASHKYRRTKSSLLSVDIVNSYFLQPRVGSQRKRLSV
jgi:hypothetical protein